MMYRTLPAALLFASIGLFGPETAPAQEKKEAAKDEFFNGKDLDGWEGLKEYWSVKDGAIVGSTPEGHQIQHLPVQQEEVRRLRAEVPGQADARSATAACRSAARSTTRRSSPSPARSATWAGPYWGSLYGENFGGMMKSRRRQAGQESPQGGRLQRLLHQVRRQARHHQAQRRNHRGRRLREDARHGIIAWQLHAGPGRWK